MRLSHGLAAISIWAQSLISTLGYPGLGLIMLLENIFPPIPSEIVLPLAGWLTLNKESHFTLLGVTLVGVIGSVSGALFFYALGYGFDERRVRSLLRRFGRWLMLDENDLDVAMAWFGRYGEYVIFFGRMIPVVRSLISVPAGLVRMNIAKFTLYTAFGTALWSFLLALAGRLLGVNWPLVSRFIDQYQNLVIVIGVGIVGYFLATRWRKLHRPKPVEP